MGVSVVEPDTDPRAWRLDTALSGYLWGWRGAAEPRNEQFGAHALYAPSQPPVPLCLCCARFHGQQELPCSQLGCPPLIHC